MGKEKEGKLNPLKGKPSGTKTQKGVTTTNSSTLHQQIEIEDRYTEQADTDSLASNVRLRHPNRNVDKSFVRRTGANKRSAPSKSVSEKFKTEFTTTTPEELPAFLSKDGLKELTTFTADCCISIYVPTHRAGVEVNEQMDPIAFKNALQRVEATLKERQIDQTKIARMLKPGYDLLRDAKFWYALTEGLAVYIAEGFFKYTKLPSNIVEKSVINTSFYLSPLVPFFLNKEYFYLLILSKKQAKLYRADNFGMKYIDIPELPNGVDDVVHFEEKGDQKLFRTGSSGAGEGANYHGIGAGKPDEKENIAMYLEEVDETLWEEILHDKNVPLLLGGVEYILPLYKKVSKYNRIWDNYLTGNLEYLNEQELYRQAREVMVPYFQERLNKAKEAYGNQSATARTSSIPENVIPAAYYARVSQLFVEKDAQLWGTFDEKENKLTVHAQQEATNESLIDKAIMKTIMNGGEVFIVDKENMPASGPVAALMRFES